MSGRRNRNKGANAEREVARIINERLGLALHRTPLSGGMQWRGDVQGLPGHHVEVKRCETYKLDAWLKQTEEDAPEGTVPLLVFRKSHQPWRVVMSLDHYLDVLERHGTDTTS